MALADVICRSAAQPGLSNGQCASVCSTFKIVTTALRADLLLVREQGDVGAGVGAANSAIQQLRHMLYRKLLQYVLRCRMASPKPYIETVSD